VRRRALGLIAAAFAALVVAGPGGAATVTVLVRPDVSLDRLAERGAVGLLVPGSGATVTGRGALAALVRGRVVNSAIATVPGGAPAIALGRRPAATTIYVSLPPPGRHHNTTRYPIAIVGGGYRGLLVSGTTHIPGLVAISDVAPTVRALQQGKKPVLRWRDDSNAAHDLRALDRHLTRAHDERTAALLAIVAGLVIFLVPAVFLRSLVSARAALLAPLAMIAIALVLSALDVTDPLTLVGVGAGGCIAAVAAGSSDRRFVSAVALFLVGFLVVLVGWPEVNALVSFGPHPDGGVRFYGVTNQVETVLLAPVIAAVALSGPAVAAALGALALLTVGWSRAGADGGGLVVYAVGLGVVAFLRLRPGSEARRRWAPAAVVVSIALALALVAIDAATGGSNHVTHALGGGPGSLARDFARRMHLSWAGTASSPVRSVLVVASIIGLVWFATRTPRTPALTAVLVAIAVSVLVNDTPVDVLGFGALSCIALWAWQRAAPEASAGATSVSGSSAAARPPSRPRTPATR
jgi:hypothetical protein